MIWPQRLPLLKIYSVPSEEKISCQYQSREKRLVPIKHEKSYSYLFFGQKKKQIFNSVINGRRGIDLSSLGCLFTNSRPRFITTEHQQFPLGISDCYVKRILNNSSYPVCIIPSSAIERYFIPCCNHQPPRSESFTFNIN